MGRIMKTFAAFFTFVSLMILATPGETCIRMPRQVQNTASSVHFAKHIFEVRPVRVHLLKKAKKLYIRAEYEVLQSLHGQKMSGQSMFFEATCTASDFAGQTPTCIHSEIPNMPGFNKNKVKKSSTSMLVFISKIKPSEYDHAPVFSKIRQRYYSYRLNRRYRKYPTVWPKNYKKKMALVKKLIKKIKKPRIIKLAKR